MKTIYNKELAKLAEQMATGDKAYAQMQMAVAPQVLEKVEAIFPAAVEVAEEAGLLVEGKSFEWTDKGNFIIYLGLQAGTGSMWTKEDLTSKPGSRLNNVLFGIGQIKDVAYTEPNEEDPLYLLIYG